MDETWRRAVIAGDVDRLQRLLAGGADVDALDRYGQTALMLAIVNGSVEVARRLVQAGADRTLRGSGAPGFADKTAYDLARARGLQDLFAELEC